MSHTLPHRTEAARRLIEELMRTLLSQSPGAVRIRLAVVRDGLVPAGSFYAGMTGHTATESLRYEVIANVAAQGRRTGRTGRDRPLSDWSHFLPSLLAGQCAMRQFAGDAETMPPFGCPTSRVANVLICPAANPAGLLSGAVFIMWDRNDQPPRGAALRELQVGGLRVACQIAAVLHLCAQTSGETQRGSADVQLDPV